MGTMTQCIKRYNYFANSYPLGQNHATIQSCAKTSASSNPVTIVRNNEMNKLASAIETIAIAVCGFAVCVVVPFTIISMMVVAFK